MLSAKPALWGRRRLDAISYPPSPPVLLFTYLQVNGVNREPDLR